MNEKVREIDLFDVGNIEGRSLGRRSWGKLVFRGILVAPLEVFWSIGVLVARGRTQAPDDEDAQKETAGATEEHEGEDHAVVCAACHEQHHHAHAPNAAHQEKHGQDHDPEVLEEPRARRGGGYGVDVLREERGEHHRPQTAAHAGAQHESHEVARRLRPAGRRGRGVHVAPEEHW